MNAESTARSAQAPVSQTRLPVEATGPLLRIEPTSALALVEKLEVKGRAPKTGYDRLAFGVAWDDVDHNGCDTRNDVLTRDLKDIAFVNGSGCLVASGRLEDLYTGKTIQFQRGPQSSASVQIDHIVALGDAWQKGAQQLTPARRLSLANDPLNLIAVDGPANQKKSDADAATWLPPRHKLRCQYIARQISVKAAYGLWVTQAEKEAMKRVLSTCPDQRTYTSPRA